MVTMQRPPRPESFGHANHGIPSTKYCLLLADGRRLTRSMDDALRLFVRIPKPLKASWNLMKPIWNPFCRVHASSVKPIQRSLYTDISSSFVPCHPFAGSRQNCKFSIAENMMWHARLAKTPILLSDVSVSNRLADSYCLSGLLDAALHLLAEITHSKPVSWNQLISSYNQSTQFDGSLRAFCRMRLSGLEPTEYTYGSILSACSASQDLWFAQQVHSLVLKNGYLSDDYVFTGLVDLFVKNGCFDEALRVFSETYKVDNVVSWNAIIAGGVRNAENWIALDLFRKMSCSSCVPNAFTFSSVLTACIAEGELEMGKGIHGWVVKCGMEYDIFVGTGIVDLYVKCGDADDALKEFSLMPVQNVVSWTAIIAGFVQKQDFIRALLFLNEMRQKQVEINKYTVTSVFIACAKPEMVREAFQMHCLILKSGLSVNSSVTDALISTYGKTGNVDMAEKVFKEMADLVSMGSWAAIISCLAQNLKVRRSIDYFQRMFLENVRPDEFCTSSILSIISSEDLGKQVHSFIVKSGMLPLVCVSCALLTMYSRCGNLSDSYNIFKQMAERDKITWTSMIAGFAEHNCANEAFQLFSNMIIEGKNPDQMTLAAILTACSAKKLLTKGKEIHGHIFRTGLWFDMHITGALITMYSKCRALDYAVRIFNMMPRKGEFLWSSLVSGYAQNGCYREALLGFNQMIVAGFKVDHFTISSALVACTNLTNPAYGKNLHALIIKAGFCHCLLMSSSLITMYAKCGSIGDSRRAFDHTKEPDLVTWTAMIDGYAQHGMGEEALKMYEQMVEGGTEPDSVTFVSVLSACSHSGLVEEGFFHFNSMTRTYSIEPEVFHYACMVDLLCRCGKLKEATSFVDTMPLEPDLLMWTTILGACRLHGELDLGKKAAQKIMELEPNDSGAYISLSNMCAEVGDWEEVLKIRESMKGAGAIKEPGWSSM